MNSWPSTLPQRMLVNGYQTGLGDGRLRSSTDAGVAKLRRRFSAVPRPLSGSIMATAEQLETFKTFVEDTLKGGVLPFTFPAQGEDGTWTCQIGQNAPTWSASGPDVWTISLDLVILP